MESKVTRKEVLALLGAAALSLREMRTASADSEPCTAEGHPCTGVGNTNCCPGLICAAGGGPGAVARCVGAGSPPLECNHNSDCDQNELCVEGVCVPCPPPPDVPADPECVSLNYQISKQVCRRRVRRFLRRQRRYDGATRRNRVRRIFVTCMTSREQGYLVACAGG